MDNGSENFSEQTKGLEGDETAQLLTALKSMGVAPSQLRKYVRAAMRLRELEKQYGKSYNVLLRDYEKKFRESVKLEYAITELLEKRKRIEDDLNVYMEQHKLTLETVNKVVTVIRMLEQYSVDVNNLEILAKAAARISQAGLDVNKVFEHFARLEEADKSLRAVNEQILKEQERLSQIQAELAEKEERLRKMIQWTPELESLERIRQTLENKISELEGKHAELSRKLEEEAKQYETLIGFKGDAESVYNAIKKKKAELERLNEEVERKRETLEILEEEVSSARSLLMLLQNPELVRREDLEALSRQLANVASVKAGEAPVLKPLEHPLVENVRKKVVELVLPAIKNDLIPRWVFEKLEKEFKDVVAKKAQLEEENEKLKAELQRYVSSKPISSEETPPQSAVFFRLRKKAAPLQDDSGIRVRLKCPYCQSTNLLVLPSKGELDRCISEGELLITTCSRCAKDISVDPVYLNERFYRG